MCVLSLVQLDVTVNLEAFFETGSADFSDFNSSSLSYTFEAGSVAGHTVCSSVGVTMDGIVENREDFTVVLSVTAQDVPVNITGGRAMVFIEDSTMDSEFITIISSSHICCCTFNKVGLEFTLVTACLKRGALNIMTILK